MAHPRSMKVKEVKCEGLQATVVQRAAENNFKSVLFAIVPKLHLSHVRFSRRKLPRSAEIMQSKGIRSTLQIQP